MSGRVSFTRSMVIALLVVSASFVGCREPEPPAAGVRILVRAPPSSLDPHLQDETPAYDLLINVYEGLVRFDAEMGIEPALAESWSSPDDLTWRFVLRSGVRFHDGTELDAVDVVSSLERARSHPQSRAAGYLSAVDEIRADGGRTVEIRTHDPYPILLQKLAFVWVVPAPAPVDPIEDPVGTGPYRLVDRREGGVTLESFVSHWDAPVSIPRAEIETVPEATDRVSALLAGRADLAMSVPVHQIGRIDVDPSLELISHQTLDVAYLHVDHRRPPFSDRRVRRALHLGLDRAGLVEETLPGFAQPTDQFVPPAVFGYDATAPPPQRDLEAARRLLAEAGHPDGVDVVLDTYSAEPTALLDRLEEIGFRVTLRSQDWSEVYQRLVDGESTFYYGLYSLSSGEASDLLDGRVHSRDLDRGYGESNYGRYSNPEVDQLIERIAGTLDFAERQLLMQQCFEIMAGELPLIPVYVPFSRAASRKDLLWSPRADGAIDVGSMEWVASETASH